MNIIESIWSVYEWRRQIAVDSSWKKRQVALARSTSYYTPGIPIRNSSNFRFDFWCFLVPFTIAPTIHYLCTERFSVMRKTFTLPLTEAPRGADVEVTHCLWFILTLAPLQASNWTWKSNFPGARSYLASLRRLSWAAMPRGRISRVTPCLCCVLPW